LLLEYGRNCSSLEIGKMHVRFNSDQNPIGIADCDLGPDLHHRFNKKATKV